MILKKLLKLGIDDRQARNFLRLSADIGRIFTDVPLRADMFEN